MFEEKTGLQQGVSTVGFNKLAQLDHVSSVSFFSRRAALFKMMKLSKRINSTKKLKERISIFKVLYSYIYIKMCVEETRHFVQC